MNDDARYTIGLEYTGHISGTPQHVVRFCGDFVGAAPTLILAQAIEGYHIAGRGFDLLASFDEGDCAVIWVKRGKSHRIVYGAEVIDTNDATKACHIFGESVHHSLMCAGHLD
jgi:hypothetical protein